MEGLSGGTLLLLTEPLPLYEVWLAFNGIM
jgi:hypothetical protein